MFVKKENYKMTLELSIILIIIVIIIYIIAIKIYSVLLQITGLPENITINSAEIREALAEPLSHIIEAIKITLERTPPELAADIIDQGITLAGGGALLKGLDKLINNETGMPVYIAEDPLDCVAHGTGRVLDDIDELHDVLDNDDSRYY